MTGSKYVAFDAGEYVAFDAGDVSILSKCRWKCSETALTKAHFPENKVSFSTTGSKHAAFGAGDVPTLSKCRWKWETALTKAYFLEICIPITFPRRIWVRRFLTV
jgi:uncharacterized cupin superfamily protein